MFEAIVYIIAAMIVIAVAFYALRLAWRLFCFLLWLPLYAVRVIMHHRAIDGRWDDNAIPVPYMFPWHESLLEQPEALFYRRSFNAYMAEHAPGFVNKRFDEILAAGQNANLLDARIDSLRAAFKKQYQKDLKFFFAREAKKERARERRNKWIYRNIQIFLMFIIAASFRQLLGGKRR